MNQSTMNTFNEYANNALAELLMRHYDEFESILGGYLVDQLLIVEPVQQTTTRVAASSKTSRKAVAPKAATATKSTVIGVAPKMTRSESARHASQARWAAQRTAKATTIKNAPRRNPQRRRNSVTQSA